MKTLALIPVLFFIVASAQAQENMFASANTHSYTLNDLHSNKAGVEFYLNKAETSHKEGKYNFCIEYCDLILKNDATNHRALFLKAVSYAELKNYHLAIEHFTHLVNIYHDDINAYYNRAIMYYSIHAYNEALLDFNRVIELEPNDAEAYHYRSIIKEELKDPLGACNDITQAHLLGYRESKDIRKNLCSKK
jgi:tetratricopeptide (TPR) repeat protein